MATENLPKGCLFPNIMLCKLLLKDVIRLGAMLGEEREATDGNFICVIAVIYLSAPFSLLFIFR